MEKQSQKSRTFLLIFLGWLVYATSYLGKVNYSANITQITEFYGITKTQAGLPPTFFFFAYGIGQVLNGFFCKKYHIKWMIFGSLLISAVINFILAVTPNFAIIKWLWMANGLVLSVLWPTIIRLLSEVLPQKVLGTASIVMGTTVASGTIFVYASSSVYAAFHQFKLAFYTAAFVMAVVSVIWVLLYHRATAMATSEKNAEETKKAVDTDTPTQAKLQKNERNIFFTSIGVLCFYAIGVNLIKDGLTTWVPSILKESFDISNALSILLTLFLPVLAIFGNAFALKVHKKIPDYVNHCLVVFVTIAILIGMIIGSLKLQSVGLMLTGLVAVNFLASSLNSLITSIFPLFMRGKVNSGLFAGILNGFCYLGSTISSYGLGSIADYAGWNSVFLTLMGFCAISSLVWLFYTLMKRISCRKNILVNK